MIKAMLFLELQTYAQQHIPILRYLSRRAGSYDGETNYEKFLVDAVSDVYVDWRASSIAPDIEILPLTCNFLGCLGRQPWQRD